MTLKNQIDEKKRMKGENRIYDNKYDAMIKSNLEKFRTEKENKVRISQERVVNYKDLLDRQVTEKGNRKNFMDEKEKQYNKELIGKIYTELNIGDSENNSEY